MKISVKKLKQEAIIPKYAHDTDAGLDLYSIEDYTLKSKQRYIFKIGISVQIPDGYVGLFWDKSGLAAKFGIKVMGGVIDNGYRGEYGIILYNTSDCDFVVKKGDKIAQMLIQKVEHVEVEEVDVLSETDRSDGGFGSSGR
ncbi:MAG: dUTP diphosphatase [Patescibacteria group bacterium]|jgi:dUTP pyrophosphatase